MQRPTETHADIHAVETHTPQLPTLTDDFLRQLGDVRQCEFNLSKNEYMHTHTQMHRSMHSPTQAWNRMRLVPLNLNYIAPMVPSISIRPSAILSSIVLLHSSCISHPSSLPSFNLRTPHPQSSDSRLNMYSIMCSCISLCALLNA